MKNKTLTILTVLFSLLVSFGLTSCDEKETIIEISFPIQGGQPLSSDIIMNYNFDDLNKQENKIEKHSYIYSNPIKTDYKIVEKLGFKEADETTSDRDSTSTERWFKKSGKLLRIDQYGSFTYATGAEDTFFEMPLNEHECMEIAKEYLSSLGLLDENISSQWSTNERSVTTDGVKTVIGIGVNLFVELDDKLVYGNNQISVDINGNGEITAVYYSVTRYKTREKVTLLNTDDAITHIDNKQGLFNVSTEAEILDFEKVSLAYWKYENENGNYLIPVYVFEGTEKTSDNNTDSFMIVVQADR